jgi:hypothetical protein
MTYSPPTKKAFAKHDLYSIEEEEIDYNVPYSKKNIPKIKSEKVLKKGSLFFYYEDDGLWYDDGEYGFRTNNDDWVKQNLTEPEDIVPSFNDSSDKDRYNILDAINYINGSDIVDYKIEENKQDVCDWLEWRVSLDENPSYLKSLCEFSSYIINKYRENNNKIPVLKMGTLELDYLLGDHVLSGCDTDGSIKEKKWSQASVVDFILDGKILSAVEDPEDDYRSSLDSLLINREGAIVKNKFPDCFVTGVRGTNGVEDVVRLIDKTTGKIVLAIGTDNNDSYYPVFVGEFDPTAMKINQKE